MDLRTLLAASRPEPEAQARSRSQQPGTGIVQQLLQLAELVDTDPFARKIVAEGIARFIDGKGVLEGKPVLSAVFAGSFQRCALLWKLLLKELDAFSCPQRLLLKLEYCQGFCIRVFSSSPLDTKRSLVSENAASITFALDLSIAVLQGIVCLVCWDVSITVLQGYRQVILSVLDCPFLYYMVYRIFYLHPEECCVVKA